MNKRQTQCEKILQILKDRGSSGVHSFDLLSIAKRAAARIDDLKDAGYGIESKPERKGDAMGVRYTLKSMIEKPKERVFVGFEGNNAIFEYR